VSAIVRFDDHQVVPPPASKPPASLRGDAGTAGAVLAALVDLRASEDPRTRRRSAWWKPSPPPPASRKTRCATLAHAGALGISAEILRWAWPLAARAACELGDTATTGELLALLDSYQVAVFAGWLAVAYGPPWSLPPRPRPAQRRRRSTRRFRYPRSANGS
jgi:hypothetical protein